MEVTNLYEFYKIPQAAEAKTQTYKPSNPPPLKEALKLVTAKLLPYAMTLTQSLDDAEDLCQQTIMRLIEKEDQFLGAEYPYAFAKKVLKNLFIDRYRKHKKEVSLEAVEIEPECQGQQYAAVEHQDLLKCLSKHNETDRTILAMLGAGHSYDDIQRVLGKITMANLRVKTLRARKTLAECLGRNA
jgi:RNA polymerase sigma factor (sigma-70 family)